MRPIFPAFVRAASLSLTALVCANGVGPASVLADSAEPPVHLVARSSSALEASGKNLQVGREQVRFNCADFECRVVVEYALYAERASEQDLELLVPTGKTEDALLNEEPIAPQTELTVASPSNACVGVFDCLPPASASPGSLAPEAWRYHCWHGTVRMICEEDLQGGGSRTCSSTVVDKSTRCEEARVKLHGRLRQGWNSLRLSYRQPLEFDSRSSEPGIAHSRGELGFSYLLYPLEQWTHAENFRLSVEVHWSLPRRSIFGRLFRPTRRNISCGRVAWDGDSLELHSIRPDGDVRTGRERGRSFEELTYTFSDTMPRIFGCRAQAFEVNEDFHGDLSKFMAARERQTAPVSPEAGRAELTGRRENLSGS